MCFHIKYVHIKLIRKGGGEREQERGRGRILYQDASLRNFRTAETQDSD